MQHTMNVLAALRPSNTWRRLGRSMAGLALLTGLGLVAGAGTANAQLTVCNRSDETVSMALAFRESSQPEGHATALGWFVAKPGECPTLVSGPLGRRYYFVRGEGTSGARWAGDYQACTARSKFNYAGSTGCPSGFELSTFFRIDTGSSTSWTHSLTVAAPAPAAAPAPRPAAPTHRDNVSELKVGWRQSALDDGSRVMQLHNARLNSVDVNLRCYTNSGESKVLGVNVPAKGMSEVGFVQGWPGNFVSGERCEAYSGSDVVWQVRVP
jgi:uncharacterized membrane protein